MLSYVQHVQIMALMLTDVSKIHHLKYIVHRKNLTDIQPKELFGHFHGTFNIDRLLAIRIM